MKARYLSLPAVLAVAALALSSCAESPAGIFSRVADETRNDANMTEAIENATPAFVARLGSTYYAGIGTFWKKAEADQRWSQADVSGVATGAVMASSGAVVSVAGADALFVAFTNATGSSLGVRSTSDGTSWSAAKAGIPSGQNLLSVIAARDPAAPANDRLFAVTTAARTASTTPATYSIYYLTGDAFAATSVVDDATIGAPTSVAWNGSNYVFTAGAKIIVGPSMGSLAVLSTPPAATEAYSGVCAYDGNVVVSSRNGRLYHSADSGATWTQSALFVKASNSKAFSFSAPTYVGYGAKKVLVVGTNRIPRLSTDIPSSDGYLEFDISSGLASLQAQSSDHTLLSSSVNFASSLAGSSLSAMPVFAPAAGTLKVFALTDSNGLWSNGYASGAWSGWVRE